MDDKLITLAILTYSKAQILKGVLESEGVEAYIHNINLIQPVVSTGVRLRIKESDLPKALKITESATWLAETVVDEKLAKSKQEKKDFILIPVDFSDYSFKACQIGFNMAHDMGVDVVLLHVYFSPLYNPMPYGIEMFNYQITDDEETKNALHKIHADLNKLSDSITDKIKTGEYPNANFTCILREGIPEEEILKYAKDNQPITIIMGTRGKTQKDIDLIGSVTAEVIERSKVSVLAIPINTSLNNFKEVKHIALLTNFDQRDLISFDTFIRFVSPYTLSLSLIHLSEEEDKWNEIKLAGIKEYFQKQYPKLEMNYDVVLHDDILVNLDNYIKEHKVDIITLTSYKRNIFSRLFNPSIARKMLFHSDTPLLVIK